MHQATEEAKNAHKRILDELSGWHVRDVIGQWSHHRILSSKERFRTVKKRPDTIDVQAHQGSVIRICPAFLGSPGQPIIEMEIRGALLRLLTVKSAHRQLHRNHWKPLAEVKEGYVKIRLREPIIDLDFLSGENKTDLDLHMMVRTTNGMYVLKLNHIKGKLEEMEHWEPMCFPGDSVIESAERLTGQTWFQSVCIMDELRFDDLLSRFPSQKEEEDEWSFPTDQWKVLFHRRPDNRHLFGLCAPRVNQCVIVALVWDEQKTRRTWEIRKVLQVKGFTQFILGWFNGESYILHGYHPSGGYVLSWQLDSLGNPRPPCLTVCQREIGVGGHPPKGKMYLHSAKVYNGSSDLCPMNHGQLFFSHDDHSHMSFSCIYWRPKCIESSETHRKYIAEHGPLEQKHMVTSLFLLPDLWDIALRWKDLYERFPSPFVTQHWLTYESFLRSNVHVSHADAPARLDLKRWEKESAQFLAVTENVSAGQAWDVRKLLHHPVPDPGWMHAISKTMDFDRDGVVPAFVSFTEATGPPRQDDGTFTPSNFVHQTCLKRESFQWCLRVHFYFEGLYETMNRRAVQYTEERSEKEVERRKYQSKCLCTYLFNASFHGRRMHSFYIPLQNVNHVREIQRKRCSAPYVEQWKGMESVDPSVWKFWVGEDGFRHLERFYKEGLERLPVRDFFKYKSHTITQELESLCDVLQTSLSRPSQSFVMLQEHYPVLDEVFRTAVSTKAFCWTHLFVYLDQEKDVLHRLLGKPLSVLCACIDELICNCLTHKKDRFPTDVPDASEHVDISVSEPNPMEDAGQREWEEGSPHASFSLKRSLPVPPEDQPDTKKIHTGRYLDEWYAFFKSTLPAECIARNGNKGWLFPTFSSLCNDAYQEPVTRKHA
mmetsp:Transcript_40699/g.105638  ORF Transcript_40699/g.105638 Transcript_40699/m.105638 type:complete len:881 (+) Transcript_40699:396-3038(+)|eukprot:CAMPEP_0113872338 /NCGR_PEP_ID=MMETSP0780_2-20120614/3152_1 /TAXON_ID=652834 /ORGANISM="Palpitomonas bilix" /LENGTH=880 /DNA_ID=CAMNT_0000857847 /DNA_START=1147 /DNA_END=3789 /DNA_ORIENTATION=+ /assembly_acc=CAM_ASM_000599